MKTAALITKHAANNYGAVLQSLATQNAVEGLGISCEIIDYQTERCVRESKLFSSGHSTETILYNVRNLFTMGAFFTRRRNFVSYRDRYFHLSDKRYTKDTISSLPLDKYDFFITGSDQTFNLNLAGAQDVDDQKPYFWDFIGDRSKIAFASSVGEHLGKITADQRDWLAEQLRSYQALAVRESSLAEYIETLIGVRPEVVIDPTFLMDTAAWDQTAKPTKYDHDEYILFYSVMSEPWVIEYVKALSRQTGLKVLAPHPKNRFELFGTGFERVDKYGPAEFISLIKHAKLVVATSFHGTAFAINYNKPVIPLVLGEGNRIRRLLSLCGMEDVAVTQTEQDKDYHKAFEIDYAYANQQITLEKTRCLNFLKRAMNIE